MYEVLTFTSSYILFLAWGYFSVPQSSTVANKVLWNTSVSHCSVSDTLLHLDEHELTCTVLLPFTRTSDVKKSGAENSPTNANDSCESEVSWNSLDPAVLTKRHTRLIFELGRDYDLKSSFVIESWNADGQTDRQTGIYTSAKVTPNPETETSSVLQSLAPGWFFATITQTMTDKVKTTAAKTLLQLVNIE